MRAGTVVVRAGRGRTRRLALIGASTVALAAIVVWQVSLPHHDHQAVDHTLCGEARHLQAALGDTTYGPGQPGSSRTFDATVVALSRLQDAAPAPLRSDLDFLTSTLRQLKSQAIRDANGALDLLPPPDRIQYHVAYTNVAMSLYRECGVELARR